MGGNVTREVMNKFDKLKLTPNQGLLLSNQAFLEFVGPFSA